MGYGDLFLIGHQVDRTAVLLLRGCEFLAHLSESLLLDLLSGLLLTSRKRIKRSFCDAYLFLLREHCLISQDNGQCTINDLLSTWQFELR